MKKNILILDDNIEILLLIKKLLEGQDYNITTFSSSIEAFNFLLENSNTIDLILIDVVMPDIDGMEFLDDLINKHSIKIPYIFISARNESFLKKLTAYNQESEFIQKPIEKTELIKKINKLLN